MRILIPFMKTRKIKISNKKEDYERSMYLSFKYNKVDLTLRNERLNFRRKFEILKYSKLYAEKVVSQSNIHSLLKKSNISNET